MRNLKKVVALIAVFAMMVSTVAFAQTFGDVKDGDNYYEAIETLNKLGIITGDDENNDGVMEFRPEDSITRAEIAVIVARIKGQTGAVAQTNTVFTDVPATHWASGYIAQATNQGIVNGYGDGTFGPDDKVLYQDVVKMLMETLGYKPYAAENGGYPTGYLLAAQQQNVLKGVIGGVDSQEATRGQVAQLTYNAIDTPLMDRYVYGTGQGQYVVWDGEAWSPRKTLMNQYLGIQKLRGIVSANNVTGLDSITTIDTSAVSKISLDIEDNYLGSNTTNDEYAIGETVNLNVGDTNANDYLGYDVVTYVKDNKNDTDTVLSITEATGRNTKASFTLDKFDSLEETTQTYLCYMKNDTDRAASKLRLASDVQVIYNGRNLTGTANQTAIERVFGSNGIIQKDTAFSGEVVLLDNDDVTDYDVVFVNVAASAVVDEVSTRGVVTFMNQPGAKSTLNSFTKIDFGSTSDDQLIRITKDGQPFDYTELKKWNVLSVVAYTTPSDVFYDIEVIGDTAIEGSVSRTSSSDTSSDGLAYTINGVDYDLVEGVYTNGTLKAGSAGTFYIDKYGKIVAYDKNGTVNQTSENYGYVLDGAVNAGNFGSDIPQLQILYKDGSIGTYDFASTVTIDNPTQAVMDAVGDNDDSVSYKYKDHGNEDEIINSIVGQVITFSATNGVIKNMTLASTVKADGDTTLALQAVSSAATSSYDENDKQFIIDGKKYDVADDTVVFYIGRSEDSFAYGQKAEGNATENCSVGTGEQLKTISGAAAAAYLNGNSNGTMDVVVIYNKNAGVGANEGVAYVTSIGTTTVDGSKVLSVQYYQDGELKEAVTDSTNVSNVLTIDTVPGSLFKFGFSGDTITSADAYLLFNGTVRDKEISDQESGIPNVAYVGDGVNADEEVYFGAVLKKVNSRLTIATIDETSLVPDLSTVESVNLGSYDVKAYTYDPTRSGKSKFAVGSIGDVTVDKTLTNDNGTEGASLYSIDVDGVTIDSPAWGMLDYVFVRTYERTADLVDYMAYEYDWTFEKN
ncbi:MAG: S-layer homology domain-containing protein [Clostridiales bacterium]|nr:S-layer homology domain-containing protein [Clostridiales bacterium]